MPLDSLNLAGVLGFCGAGEASPDPYLPFVDHCRPAVMLLRDGSLLGMARLAGQPSTVASNQGRNGHVMRHTAWLNAIANDNVEVFEHLVRHDGVPAQAPRPPACGSFDAAFLADYDADVRRHLRVNDWFISVLVKPRKDLVAVAKETVRKLLPAPKGERLREMQEDAEALDGALLGQLEDAFSLLFGLMHQLRPVRLGIRQERGLPYSEIAEALELIRTTKHDPQPIVDPAGTLGAGLAVHDPIAGRRGFEIRYGQGGTDAHYGTILGVTAWPRDVGQEQMDDLLSLPGRFTLTNHIRFMNRAQQQEHLMLLKRLAVTGDDPDSDAAGELQDAVRLVARGMAVRGHARWSLALHADGEPSDDPNKVARSAMREVDRLVSLAKTIMVGAGIKVAPEGKGAKCALLAQTPGSPRRTQIRAGSYSTDYFASLSTLVGFARGPSEYQWKAPLLRYATTGGTPFDDDLFVKGVAHCPVIAPNGEGKTVWIGANVTAVRALVRAGRRPGTQILIDVDGSNEQTVLANEGTYLHINGSGVDSGVAPLLLPNTARNRAMLRTFISGLTRVGNDQPLTGAEIVAIREGVDFVMHEMAPHERHLGVVRSFLGFAPDGAGARLERWCRQFNGDLAWVFDGREHRINFDVELAGVDLTAVMDDEVVMPVLGQMVLWLASEMMDGRRCVVWCEEAPAYFSRPEFSKMGKAIALRARKRNACFIPVAQMPEHLLNNEAGKAIIKQSRKLVLFRNGGAERADYCDGLGVSEPVFEMVRKGMFELPYHAVAVVRTDGQTSINRFDLSALPQYLAVFSATTNSVALFRSIRAANPGAAMPAILNEFWRRLPEAAA